MSDRAEQFRTAALAAKPTMGPGDRLLLDEACRLVDRLDRFDDLISGESSAWLEFEVQEAQVVVVISSVVAEARQTVSELRQVVTRLNLPAAEEAPASGGILRLLNKDAG
jgi:hypothetical protein